MKFTANVELLARALRPVIVASQTAVLREYPGARLITIQVLGKTLIASANNGRIVVRTTVCLIKAAIADGIGTVKSVDLRNSLDAFKKDETLQISSKRQQGGAGRDLVIRSVRSGTYQSLPIAPDALALGELDVPAAPAFALNRDVFCKAIRVVRFANGDSNRPELTRCVLRVRRNHLRSAGGNGMRFAIYEQQGRDLIDTAGEHEILFDRREAAGIIQVIDALSVDDITFSMSPSGAIRITAGMTEIATVHPKQQGTWPNEAIYLDSSWHSRWTINLDELRQVLRGFCHKSNKKDEEIRRVSLRFDGQRRLMILTTEGAFRASRPIEVAHVTFSMPGTTEVLIFSCVVDHLADLAAYAADRHRWVQLELVGGTQWVMVARYRVDDDFYASCWERDLERQNRERTVLFFAIKPQTLTTVPVIPIATEAKP
jgi:DNA polymerase III sliding clamp (beta) subunit (PCNA family)